MQNHAQRTSTKPTKTMKTRKKRKYEQRVIDIEKAAFTTLVFSCTGGAGPSAAKTIKRIAGKQSEKREDLLSHT